MHAVLELVCRVRFARVSCPWLRFGTQTAQIGDRPPHQHRNLNLKLDAWSEPGSLARSLSRSLSRACRSQLYPCTWLPSPRYLFIGTHTTEPYRSLSIIDHVSTVEWPASMVRSTQPVCMHACIQCIHLPPPAPSLPCSCLKICRPAVKCHHMQQRPHG